MKFTLGERKEVTIEIVSTRSDPFTITAASFELKRVNDNTVEASGVAEITDHEVRAIITPQAAGVYKLYFSYEIANEKLIAPVVLEVDE